MMRSIFAIIAMFALEAFAFPPSFLIQQKSANTPSRIGMVAEWAFMDREDFSGIGNRITALSNGATISGGIIDLTGSADATATVADSDSLTPSGAAMTVSCWTFQTINIPDNGILPIAAKEGSGTDRAWAFYHMSELSTPGRITTNGINFLVSQDGSTFERWDSYNLELATGTWNHVAATFDKGSFKLYANGHVVDSYEITLSGSQSATSIYNNAAAVEFGARRGNTQEHLVGKIAGARIWGRALSPNEIEVEFLKGQPQ